MLISQNKYIRVPQCPKCKSKNTEITKTRERLKCVECLDCGGTWFEFWEISGYGNFEYGENSKFQ